MEDFNGLAAALGSDLEGVRACLILSRDGLVMGAHPADAEDAAKPAWLRVATVGDPERGFFQFATETWAYVRRGPYAAFVVASSSVRPGLLIDQIERVLLAAEEGRSERPLSAKPEQTPAATAPSSKPRTPLHREPTKVDEPIVIESATVAAPAPATTPATTEATAQSRSAEPTPEAASEAAEPAAQSTRASMWATESSEEDVDTFSLAREFGQLLQDGEQGADG